jgi:hypothetical protein
MLSFDELLRGYKLEKQLLIKSLEGMKGELVSMINFVQEDSKAKDGETRRQQEQRLLYLYRSSEDIPRVSS